ncbi:Histone acetyltransferase complex subunit, partial [Coemansia sp. RSA 2599]
MEDIGLALVDFVGNMENVPSEIGHLFSEITDLDEKFEEAMSRAAQNERSLQKELKEKANREQPGARETELLTLIDKDHKAAKAYCQEKSRLAKKALTIVQRHLTKLDSEIRHFDKTPLDHQAAGRKSTGYGGATPTTL